MCQWKFFVLRYRAKKSVSKRGQRPGNILGCIRPQIRRRVERSEPSRFTLTVHPVSLSVFRLANAICEGGRAPSSGCTMAARRSDACAMLSLLDHTCGNLCGSIPARRAAVISGAASARRPRGPVSASSRGTRPRMDVATPGRSFHGQSGWQVAHRVQTKILVGYELLVSGPITARASCSSPTASKRRSGYPTASW